MSLREFKPPATGDNAKGRLKIFFGGSIEMGAARDWQKDLAAHLQTLPCAASIDIYNPRRDDWDSRWENSYDNPAFKGQVDWELARQKEADLIVYYFAGNTVSAITLLELGLFLDRAPVIGADPDYKRLGNLMVTKDHFPMDIHLGWDAFLQALDTRIAVLTKDRDCAARPKIQPPRP